MNWLKVQGVLEASQNSINYLFPDVVSPHGTIITGEGTSSVTSVPGGR